MGGYLVNLWESYDRIDEYLKGKLLTIPPYPCVSGNMVKRLLDCLENPDPAWGGLDGEVLRMVINPWQRAYQVEYRYNPSKVFTGSRRVIESATYDLMIGNYVCSYISLVPVVEAVLREWAIEKADKIVASKGQGEFKLPIFTENLICYLEEKNRQKNTNLRFQKWLSKQINYFKFMMEEVFYLRFKDSEEGVQKEFNRNRVLHLLDNVEDSRILRDNNTRIFLLLDIIAELYLCQDDNLYLENTFYANCEKNIDFNLRWKIYLKNAQELINFTDMNIIRFAFLTKDEKLCLTEAKKKKFLEQKELQIK